MANKFVYVAVIHQTRVTFPCGIVSDLSEDNRMKLIDYILYNTGIEFRGLMRVDLNTITNPVIYADGSDEIYLSLHKTLYFK